MQRSRELQTIMEALGQLEREAYKNMNDGHIQQILDVLEIQKASIRENDIQFIFFRIVLIFANQGMDEFRIEQIVRILVVLLERLDIKQLQQPEQYLTILLSKALHLVGVVNHSSISILLELISLTINKHKIILSICIPQLSSKIFELVIQYHYSKIQQKCLTIIGDFLEFVCTDFVPSQWNVSILKQKQTGSNITQGKLNELFINFSESINHSLTPKLCNIYQEFIFRIISFENIIHFFSAQAYIGAIKLYVQFSTNSQRMIQFSKRVIQALCEQTEYKQIEFYSRLKEELESIQRILIQPQIDARITIVKFKALKHYWQLYLHQNFREWMEDGVHERIITQLLQVIQFKFNHKFKHVDSLAVVAPKSDFKTLYKVARKCISEMQLDLMPINDHSQGVWNELQTLFDYFCQADSIQCFSHLLPIIIAGIDMIKQIFLSKARNIQLPLDKLQHLSGAMQIGTFLLEGLCKNKTGNIDDEWMFKLLNLPESQVKIPSQHLFTRYQSELYGLTFLMSVENQEQVSNLIYLLSLQGIFLCYVITEQRTSFIQRTSLIEKILEVQSIGIHTLSVYSQALFAYMVDESQLSLDEFIDLYVPSVIQRQLLQLQSSNLNDSIGTIKVLKHIVVHYGQILGNQAQSVNILNSLFMLFDRFYLSSNVQFAREQLALLGSILKVMGKRDQYNNDIIQIVRKIVLSTHQFYLHQMLSEPSLNIFYYSIPLLAAAPLENQPNNTQFGMNDGPNVSISDTLGVTFHEIRSIFEHSFRTNDNQKVNLILWRILKRIFQVDDSLMFFLPKSIQLWYLTIIQPSLIQQNAETNHLEVKIRIHILEFFQMYTNRQSQGSSNLKELLAIVIKDVRIKDITKLTGQLAQNLLQRFNSTLQLLELLSHGTQNSQ